MFTINNVCNPYNLYDIPELKDATVHYVIYSTNKEGCFPFTTFYLMNSNNNMVTFPYTTKDHLIYKSPDATDHIHTIMMPYCNNITNVQVMGYVLDYPYGSYDKANIYIFYEINVPITEAIEISPNQIIWPVVFWEIFKTGKVADKIIEVTVSHALHKHTTILPITYNDDTNSKYTDDPYPMIGYSLHKRNKLSFSAMFGTSRNPNGEFGNYYYYYKTVYEAISEMDPSEVYGVVRYVIYNTHHTKILDEFKSQSDTNTICILDKYILTHKTDSSQPLTYHVIPCR